MADVRLFPRAPVWELITLTPPHHGHVFMATILIRQDFRADCLIDILI
ncbi:hypothetical protein C7S16_6381 [Burkholderia thailandensis]|uniref:Uncharacterized protein n=1 Tax=Burkholderia thailandensis TaxID=57975 RepID=A0AAW9CX51_BURTH|nr:hypothetical protein [Burkholderia thailandensis]